MMKRRRIRGLAAALGAALGAAIVWAGPGLAQQAQQPPPQIDPDRFQQIDPDTLNRMQLNQEQLSRLRNTIAEDPAQTDDEAERDARGRELKPIDWVQAGQDLSAQLARRAQSGTFTTAAAPVQTAPPAQPRNVEITDLARPTLPMLLPEIAEAYTRQDQTERGLLVFPRDNAYSATFHHDGMMFEISGSRVIAARIDDPRAVRQWRALREPDGLTVTESETGLTASFTRYGAAYEIALHCTDPDTDPRCRDPETIRAVARRLVIAGGSPAGTSPEVPR